MRRLQFIELMVIVTLTVLITGCGTSGVFREPSAIKPLDEYSGHVQRDMAQMLYPGFQEIQSDLRERFSDKQMEFREDGLRIVEKRDGGGYTEGYYVKLILTVYPEITATIDFLDEARVVTSKFLDPVLVAVSRDWNNVFSPSISGVVVEFHWTTGVNSTLELVLDGRDVQQYLNARMTMQELIDRSWIRARHGERNLGRIELNTLIS